MDEFLIGHVPHVGTFIIDIQNNTCTWGVDSIIIFWCDPISFGQPPMNGGERVYDTGLKLQHGANINLRICEENIIINAIVWLIHT